MTRTTLRSCKTIITASAIAWALVGLGASPASAACTPNAGPFCIDGIVTDTNNSGVSGSTKTVDPNGSNKELGPINSSATKIGVINTAPTPMLGLTNPNAQVDLNTVYTQTAIDPNTNHVWYYFGWARDSNSGSGFISIELEKSGVPAACTGPTGYSNTACNPWKGRQTGDFLILWDQQGNGTQINLRFYDAAAGAFGPVKTLDTTVSHASYSTDLFRGEAAIDFTEAVFPKTGECQSFANTLPSTVTGNSDTADYKDTVLSAFPPVSNCGSVTITKVTQPSGLSGSFPYTLTAPGGIFNGVVDATCADPTSTTQCHATLTGDGNTNTITNLIAKSSYTLTEDPVPHFQEVSIACSLNGTSYNVFPASATFPVEATKTTACTITNKLKQGKLTVIKHVINNNGGTKVASNFQMSLGDNTTFPGSEAGTTFTLDEGYTFTVGETIDPSYTMSTSGTCSGAIVADTTQTCTVTNDDKPAYLIVIKHVINDNGGTKKAADFTTTISGVTTATPSAPGVEAPGVTNELTTVGSYSVDEGAHVGYTRTLSADCSGTIALGQTRTCTITNDDQGAHLIVIKHVVNDNGGSAKSSDFTMTVTNAANPAPFPGADTPGTNVAINAGSYSVGESSLDGYQQTSASTDCSGNIALGETKTCTITNDDIPAHLIVIKTVINNFGLTAVPSDFTMTIHDVTAIGGNSFPGSGSGTDKTLTTVGTYSVTESSLPGYTASSSVDCSGIIALGQTKTCTITNRDSKAAPAGTTGQSAVLQDSFTIASGIRPGGGASSVTFTLYTDAACTQLAKNDGTAVETQNFVPSQDGKSGGANTVKGVGPVLTSGTYYWKAAWSGDNYNQPFTTSCGKAADEQTAITFSGQ